MIYEHPNLENWDVTVHCRQLVVWLTAKSMPGSTCQLFVPCCSLDDDIYMPSAFGRLTAENLLISVSFRLADGKAVSKWSLPQPRLHRLSPRVLVAVRKLTTKHSVSFFFVCFL